MMIEKGGCQLKLSHQWRNQGGPGGPPPEIEFCLALLKTNNEQVVP